MVEMPNAVRELVQGSQVLERALRALSEEFAPDPLPINTSMSVVGRAFVEEAEPTAEQCVDLFHRVEQIFEAGTESEKDAVATGFLEAVVTAVERTPEAGWILDHAGPAARRYIEEWNRWSGQGPGD